ncbi:Detoxification-like protein [Thalictrum thalictroides]|uniref:Detoxification-like protein n=1 Tax=Thalictrum thalictroides TaxID=46969 RepID=A0A7J6WHL3_THATH|nr:Detoxification-like protein [Thalictrum thalictroides]
MASSTTATAPLLEISGHGKEEEDENKKGGFWNKLLDVEEAKTQVMFSVPMILTNLSYYCITMVSVMFAGHLGELELASGTLANSWANVTGFALMVSPLN